MDSGHTVGSVRAAGEPFGALLRRYRERAGLTQEQLAERAGLSANAVSALERGTRRRPYAHTRDALATALGITAAERVAWHEQAPQRPAPPAAATPILGRDPDIAVVGELLTTARIVTLTGPGGVGKTRLALAVAATAPDGALFVPLAGLHEPTDVLPTIAHALGLRELGPRPVADVLAAHLRHRRMLLVLDNVEHLLDAAADIGALVGAAPGVVVLATSRAPLHLRGEHVHDVAVLAPAVAAELFVARAQQAGGQLEPGAPVAEICARLDHLPLAIELAAPQTRVFTGRELLDRLGAVLLGSAGPRDAPARQQTLRATVAWSYDRLAPPAQALLRRAAVFDGGWTLAAGDLVLRGCQEGVSDALEMHRVLLDNSLIIRQADGRFGMLETVRAFAIDRLGAAGEDDDARDRHAVLFADLAAGAEARLWSVEQADALDALEADHLNLRSALRRLLDRGRIDELAAACFGAWLFWVVRGHLRDPNALAVAALATDPAPATAARLHFVAGCTALPRGDHGGAAERFADAARLAGDAETRRWALVWGANAEVYRGCADAAAKLLDTAEANVGHVASAAVIGRAHVAIATGDMPAADALLSEQVPGIEARGSAWPTGVALGIHGRVAAVLGDPERAGTLLTRSVEIFGEIGDTWGMAHQLTHIADVAAQRGDHDRATLLYGAVDALVEEVGAQVFQVWQEMSDRCQAAALEALGVGRFTQLRREGRTLAPGAVVELAAGR